MKTLILSFLLTFSLMGNIFAQKPDRETRLLDIGLGLGEIGVHLDILGQDGIANGTVYVPPFVDVDIDSPGGDSQNGNNGQDGNDSPGGSNNEVANSYYDLATESYYYYVEQGDLAAAQYYYYYYIALGSFEEHYASDPSLAIYLYYQYMGQAYYCYYSLTGSPYYAIYIYCDYIAQGTYWATGLVSQYFALEASALYYFFTPISEASAAYYYYLYMAYAAYWAGQEFATNETELAAWNSLYMYYINLANSSV